MFKYTSPKYIIGVDVYLEFRKTMRFVGEFQKKDRHFVFSYDKFYLNQSSSIEIGPDLPLTKRVHKSKTLFKSFIDRIPSKRNPAYAEYCETVGISPTEKNEIVLLATIGRRGPSSFVFEPSYAPLVSDKERQDFRKSLNLTIREFAAVYDFSTKTLQKIEKGGLISRDSQKRMDTYILFPKVAIFDLMRNGGSLIIDKRIYALEKLEKKFCNDHASQA